MKKVLVGGAVLSLARFTGADFYATPWRAIPDRLGGPEGRRGVNLEKRPKIGHNEYN